MIETIVGVKQKSCTDFDCKNRVSQHSAMLNFSWKKQTRKISNFHDVPNVNVVLDTSSNNLL